jgi:hypothetical protein
MRDESASVRVASMPANSARRLPYSDSALQHEGADLVDGARAPTDKALAKPVQRCKSSWSAV